MEGGLRKEKAEYSDVGLLGVLFGPVRSSLRSTAVHYGPLRSSAVFAALILSDRSRVGPIA